MTRLTKYLFKRMPLPSEKGLIQFIWFCITRHGRDVVSWSL